MSRGNRFKIVLNSIDKDFHQSGILYKQMRKIIQINIRIIKY